MVEEYETFHQLFLTVFASRGWAGVFAVGGR